MNVFEELVEELNVENLLDPNKAAVDNVHETVIERNVESSFRLCDESSGAAQQTFETAAPTDEANILESGYASPSLRPEAADDAEFFRKRAVEEVTGLQMVEHVLTGVEREYMKIVPRGFNDIQVKKALHSFLKITEEPQSAEHLEAEGLLIYESDAWSKSLAIRDSNISVANIRRFCENSRPVLSSQALIALARFYRTAPAGKAASSKFDFVMTRLFSHDAGNEKRRLTFGIAEMTIHIRDLYENWSNFSPFMSVAVEGSGAEVLCALRQAIDEAESAESFDQMVASDFFNRTRGIKESAGDLLFIPEVTAAAIECNVRVGNRFVDLLRAEKARFSNEALEEKYGYSYDSLVSAAAGKTLSLADLIKQKLTLNDEEDIGQPSRQSQTATGTASERQKPVEKKGNWPTTFAVNGWLLAFSVIAVALSIGLYFWSEGYSMTGSQVSVAPEVGLENSGLSEYLSKAKSSSETMYGVVRPSWNTMDEQQKLDFVRKAQAFADTKGLRRVNLLNEQGQSVAYGRGERVELFNPSNKSN